MTESAFPVQTDRAVSGDIGGPTWFSNSARRLPVPGDRRQYSTGGHQRQMRGLGVLGSRAAA